MNREYLRALLRYVGRKFGAGVVAVTAVGSAALYIKVSDLTPSIRLEKDALNNRTYIVTGGTSGIGYQVCKILAEKQARVLIAARDEDTCAEARRNLASDTGSKRVFCRKCDLTDPKSVRKFAEDVIRDVRRIDALVNCAGVRTVQYERDARGIELQYSTNFLGAFLLTNLLADKMLNQTITEESMPDTAYVVNVDCINASKFGDINDITHMTPGDKYDRTQAYFNSKAALLAFTKELAERINGDKLQVFAAGPDCDSATNLAKPMLKKMWFPARWFYKVNSFLRHGNAQGAAISVLAPMFEAKWQSGWGSKYGEAIDVKTEAPPNRNGGRYLNRKEVDYPESLGTRVDRVRLWEMAALWCQLEEQKGLLAEELAEPKPKKKRGALAKLVGEKAQLEEDPNVPKFAYSIDGEQLSQTSSEGYAKALKPSSWWSSLGLWPF